MLAVACATGRVSHARQVKGDDPDEKGYPGPPGWGLGVSLTTLPRKKLCYETHASCFPWRQNNPEVMRWAGHVVCMGERRGAYRVLVGKTEGRRPLGRSRRRWEDNIKTDLREVGWGVWAGLGWLRIGTGGGRL
jgi:hypothetical protein